MPGLTPSRIHSHIPASKVKRFAGFKADDYKHLAKLGIQIPDGQLSQMMDSAIKFAQDSVGMDALQANVIPAQINTPIQFLQTWLPGFVNIVTGARKIDELIGIDTVGNWEDEQIVQGVLELTGSSVPYSDYGNIPLSSWNPNFVARTVVRFEEGMRVAPLEEARASRMQINSASEKREAASRALEIQRNSVGFFGYNGGDNLTYGFLNDTNLPSYIEFPADGTGASTLWSSKTFALITRDIRLMVAGLRVASQDLFDPSTMKTTLALATGVIDYLSTTTDYGESVWDWLKKSYPMISVVSAPELTAANASLNVAYLYPEELKDMSTDDGSVFMQMVPTKFRVLGVQQMAKGYMEDYTNATAGVMVKRSFLVQRYYGC
jgi:hypothetical protein